LPTARRRGRRRRAGSARARGEGSGSTSAARGRIHGDAGSPGMVMNALNASPPPRPSHGRRRCCSGPHVVTSPTTESRTRRSGPSSISRSRELN
jgi:hypothetical protein